MATPQLARDEIAFGLRYVEPRLLRLTGAQAAHLRQAADDLDANPSMTSPCSSAASG